MRRKAVSGIMLTLLLTGMLVLAFDVQPVKSDYAWTETIYIRTDGSIHPADAPISTFDDVTYTLTDNIVGDVPDSSSAVVVERDNIVVDGAGYTVQGTRAYDSKGIRLSGRSNVTIKNITIKKFYYGLYLYPSSGNSIVGNNITNNYAGVGLFLSSNNIIAGNNITNNGGGIHLDYSSNYNIIAGNNITTNNWHGIYVCGYWKPCNNNTIFGNNITNNGDYGVHLFRSSGITLSGNNITNNGLGILLDSSSNDKFYHNNFINNTCQAQTNSLPDNVWDNGYPSGGNYWSDYNGADLFIGSYQNETGSDGIGDAPYIIDENNKDHYPLMQPYRGSVRNLNTGESHPTIQEAINNANEGDRIFALSGTYYEHLVIRKPLVLIGEHPVTTIIDGGGEGNVINILANNVVIQDFTIRNSGTYHAGTYCAGISIENPGSLGYGKALILGNIITNNGGLGIKFSYTSDNTVLENNITNNYIGIYLYSSLSNSISGNNIAANNMHGIYLRESNYNSISRNNITNNGYGIYFHFYSDHNKFYHNNFMDNTPQVEFHFQSGSTNFCDNNYPSGGNYWSDYTDVDVKSGPNQDQPSSDGKGDTPYVIDGNNQDNYPLMNPWTPIETSIKVNDKDYPVTIVSNSTINQIVASANTLHFKSSGPTGQKAYINIIFPMVNTTEIKVYIDSEELTPPPFPVITTNETHYFIYFEFTLSTHDIAIQFAPLEYTLTIDSSPTGVTFTVDDISHVTPWSGTYDEDISVSLEMPSTHTVGERRYYWDQWSDGETSRARPVTMNTNVTLTAYFTGPYYELTVASSPITGITFTIKGVSKTTPYTEWLLEDYYTLEMPETYNGYVWSHWLEDRDTSRTKTITLPGTIWTGVFVPAPPTCVGGEMIIIGNTVSTPSPWASPFIVLVSVIALATAISVVYVKHRKKQQA